MNDTRNEGPSGHALWALLWRAVIFFPLGVLLLALPFAILGAGMLLIAWAIAFGYMLEWWRAAACVAGIPVVVLLWRCYARWSTPAPPNEEYRGGFLL